MDAYEPLVRVKSRYFVKLKKKQELVFLMWEVDSDTIEIMNAFDGSVRRVEVPTAFSAHEYYNKVLNKLISNGWQHDDNDNGVDYD
jgi:hypothetical protein